jgi:hypothetical protein
VTWQPVDGADHYRVTDLKHLVPDRNVSGTSVVFRGAATKDHQFVVVAVDADGSAGEKSAPEVWKGHQPLAAPISLTITSDGNNLALSWAPVEGATSYELRDLKDPSWSPGAIEETAYTVEDAIYSPAEFAVRALDSSGAGQAVTQTWTPDHQLSRDEAQLAYSLPTTWVVAGSCVSEADEVDDNVSAVVSCEPLNPGSDGPELLFANQLSSGNQQTYENDHFPAAMRDEREGCDDSYPTNGTHWTWTYSTSESAAGDYICFVGGEGTNAFVWTYYAENIAVQIQGSGSATRTGLYSWWLGLDWHLK